MKNIAAALFLLVLAANAQSAPAAADAPTKTPASAEKMRPLFVPAKLEFSGMPVKLSGEKLFLVETLVDGVPAKMLLDTGASHTSLDLEWTRRTFPDAGIREETAGGGDGVYKISSQEIPLMPVSRFEVGGNVFSGFFMPLADLHGLRAARPELHDVVGVLGMNTVSLAPCRIAFGKRSLEWMRRKTVDALPGKKKLFARPVPGTDCILAAVFSPKDGKPVFALLDSGAEDSSLPAEFWTEASPEKREAVVTTHTSVRRVEITFGVPATLKFSDEFALDGVAPKLIAPGEVPKILLGLDVLSRFDLLFDFENESVFVLPPE